MTLPHVTRREAVVAGAAGAASLLLPQTAAAKAAAKVPFARTGTFPSGVASGFPSTRGVTLWTRLGETDRSQLLGLQVASDPDFKQLVVDRRVRSAAVRDFTARARITGGALQPGERYWYRFFTRTGSSPVGRFKTALPADSREPVRIAYFSCQRFEHGFFTPQDAIAADDDLDLVISLGDYVYDQDTGARARKDGTGSPNGHAETIEQWRAKHRLYRTDAGLQAMHAAHPFACIWDDCEVEGNWAADEENSAPGPERDRRIPFAVKQANAFNAYFENMPYDRVRGTDLRRIYGSMRLGANAEVFLLDTRQYRDPQPCGSGTIGQGCAEASAPRARLGAAQKGWLKDGLVKTDARWKVLANAQMMMALDLPPGVPIETDSWSGYEAERRELLEHVVAKGVRDLTSIVGDVHVYFAGDLTTTGRAGGVPAGTEFVGASVSHDALDFTGDQARDSVLTDRITLANPHLKFASFAHHGYAVVECRPDELITEFRAVRSVATPKSESFLLKRFRVAAGDPTVEEA